MSRFYIHHGDCLEAMELMERNSVDSIVTDPPYHLSTAKRFGKEGAAPAKPGPDGLYARASRGFMGQAWDGGDIAFRMETWERALRVLKPGGHLIAFSGSRTYHRMACAIEDAGFEIRDQIQWIYGSGFPKSKDAGNGWGTALKPAHEPIVVARKPLIGTVAANVQAHGTGALNIDGCRVATDDKLGGGDQSASTKTKVEGWDRPWMNDEGAKAAHAARVNSNVAKAEALGRWPANVIHDGSDEVVEAFPVTTSGAMKRPVEAYEGASNTSFLRGRSGPNNQRADSGSAARFFYCAKASKADRSEGNGHPTVKPTALMRYLCRLVTPPGGLVLDPFMGSGSTGRGAMLGGFTFIGIEQDETYCGIAHERIRNAIVEKWEKGSAAPVQAKADECEPVA